MASIRTSRATETRHKGKRASGSSPCSAAGHLGFGAAEEYPVRGLCLSLLTTGLCSASANSVSLYVPQLSPPQAGTASPTRCKRIHVLSQAAAPQRKPIKPPLPDPGRRPHGNPGPSRPLVAARSNTDHRSVDSRTTTQPLVRTLVAARSNPDHLPTTRPRTSPHAPPSRSCQQEPRPQFLGWTETGEVQPRSQTPSSHRLASLRASTLLGDPCSARNFGTLAGLSGVPLRAVGP
jgi:hypothetical protein